MHGLFDIVQRHGREQPDAVAISRKCSDGTWETTTYHDLASLAARYATEIEALAPSGAVVPLLLSRSAHCVAAVLGAGVTGRVFACVSTRLRSPQIAAIIRKCGSQVALIDGAGLLALRGAASADEIRGSKWFLIREQKWSKAHGTVLAQLRSVAFVEELGPRVPLSPVTRRGGGGEGPACCLFTSGSTGGPKGVLVTDGELLERAKAEAHLFRLTAADTVLSILPFSFVVGLNQLAAALWAGAETALLDSWLPGDILRAARDREVTGVTGVPTIWQDFLNGGFRFDRTNGHAALRYVTVSGGDLARSHLDRLTDLGSGIEIYKTYGSSEAFRAAALRPSEFAAHRYSVGREAPGTRVYILRQDGSLARPGERGEVVVSGLGLMMGYLGDEDTATKLRPNPFRGKEDGSAWAVYSGDLGFLDEQGYLHIEGRMDDMLKILGNRVYPQEIRAEILAVEGVQEAEVLPLKDPNGQSKLAAFVVTSGSSQLDAGTLRRQVAERVPSYMLPEIFRFYDRLPRTLNGKVDRTALVNDVVAAVGEDR